MKRKYNFNFRDVSDERFEGLLDDLRIDVNLLRERPMPKGTEEVDVEVSQLMGSGELYYRIFAYGQERDKARPVLYRDGFSSGDLRKNPSQLELKTSSTPSN